MRFAGFIMTYERPSILLDTVEKLFAQTLPPEKILVVDNSESTLTETLIARLADERVEYYRVGCNAGPAAAARIGLQRLTDEGFEWIYWGDDDDPPRVEEVLEEQLDFASLEASVGIVGEVGVSFNPVTARTSGYANWELSRVMDADCVAGGRQMIVHRKVVEAGILPTEKLFFGFEELDFCLNVKRAGFRIIFDGEKVKREREKRGDGDPGYRWAGDTSPTRSRVWRQYYSSRNMLFILMSNKLYFAYLITLSKIVVKSIYSFRFGLVYGHVSFRIYWSAIIDHFRNRYGRKNFDKVD